MGGGGKSSAATGAAPYRLGGPPKAGWPAGSSTVGVGKGVSVRPLGAARTPAASSALAAGVRPAASARTAVRPVATLRPVAPVRPVATLRPVGARSLGGPPQKMRNVG